MDGLVHYHKESTRSSQFVRKPIWTKLKDTEFDLFIAHARGASKGVGGPESNINNHPFTSHDRMLGMVHNGRIDDCEYNALKNKYEVRSGCDSEIILRIIEASGNNRLGGISEVFSLINHGHMAVAMGERTSCADRDLWLFRNEYRPLWVVDVRESLGQIMFVSEPSIWDDALSECENARGVIRSAKVIELPVEQIWHFSLSDSIRQPCLPARYAVEKSAVKGWEDDGVRHQIGKPSASDSVRTVLGADDKVDGGRMAGGLRLDMLNGSCDTLIDLVNNIRQFAEQKAVEESMSKAEFQRLIDELGNKRTELEEILGLI